MLRNVRLTQDSMLSRISRSSSVTKTLSSQAHNCTRRTWAILYTEVQRTAETYLRTYGIISVISWRHNNVHNITSISIVVSHFSHYFHDSEIVWHSFYGWILLDNVQVLIQKIVLMVIKCLDCATRSFVPFCLNH